MPSPSPYLCAGTGIDAGDVVLREFISSIPRAERETIDPVNGVIAMLHATHQAAEINVCVGGTPHIVIVQQDSEPIVPSEQNSRLAMEAVRGANVGLLDQKAMQEIVKELLFNDADFQTMHEALLSKVSDQKKLGLLLRGYRV